MRTTRLFVIVGMCLALLAFGAMIKDTGAQPPALRPPTNTPIPSPTASQGATTNLIPMPVSLQSTGGSFTLASSAGIYVEPASAELTAIGQYLADKLKPSTGFAIPVLATTGAPANGNLYLTTAGGDSTLGTEGYSLTITSTLVTLRAYQPTGLFRGLQTIRQLLPAAIENSTVQAGPWTMPAVTIRDYPRFAWRGYMLDVARHFFSAVEVKRAIDLMAYYKLNRFHLHLSDDQGWRLVINSWPNLAIYGGSTAVGGGPGGYFTQADYTDIVNYAAARYITVIPEIDMPGHTNAALASYAELNCNGVAPALYTGTNVGFSSLCVSKAITYTFVDNVVNEIAALTPGAYFHMGGDESSATTSSDYISFVNQAQGIINSHNKLVIGWEDISASTLTANSLIQHWNNGTTTLNGVQQGAKVIMSPASKAYLDMKYSRQTKLGQTWAGLISIQTGYSWDPETQVSGLSESSIVGVEAPLWTETIVTRADIDYMTYPRLPGYAEIGWSPATGRNWTEYKVRLGAHGPRLTALGVNFFRSSEVPWQ